jgi:catechol 2,3-dioxygenase-like lactoylglutathione lyase family enzyme
MKLNNVRLLVSKFDETFLFYRDVLGFKVTWGNLGENYAQFQTGEAGELSIFCKQIMNQVMGTSHLPAQASAQDSMALIFSMDKLDHFYNTLSNQGVQFLDKPTDQPAWGIRVVHLRDPEGNLLELISDLGAANV